MGRYEISDKKFVNPYNFVPVKYDETSRTPITDKHGELTGYIECELLTRTPLAIPDTAEKEEVRGVESGPHYFYPFMKRPDGTYMIPGSSIRGPVRSVFETVTNSCFSSLDTDTLLTGRALSGAAFEPGILKKKADGWHLYRANRYRVNLNELIKSNKDVKSGDEVYFRYIDNGDSKSDPEVKLPLHMKPGAPDTKKGYLLIGEVGPKKKKRRFESIFEEREETGLTGPIIDKALNGLKAVYRCYNDPTVNKNLGSRSGDHHGYKEFHAMMENDCIPLWFKRETIRGTTILHFSLAAIGRISFDNKLKDIVKEKAPCTDRRNLCEACRLFGMVGKSEDESTGVGSSVRFSDAVCTTPEKVGKKLTLIELGSPRISYLPFYANVSQDDYGPGRQAGYDDPGIEIRGRKYYWHSTKTCTTNEKNKRNSTVAVADAGSSFRFKVFFDGITEYQLKRLIYSLNFYENERNGNMCHKMGHGKPAGLGSVKISIDSVKVRRFSLKDGYILDDYNVNYEEKLFKESDAQTIESLNYICDFSNAMETSYPFVHIEGEDKNNGEGSYKWFAENIGNAVAFNKRKRRDFMTLPDILSDDVSLSALKSDDRSRGGNSHNNYNGRNNRGGYGHYGDSKHHGQHYQGNNQGNKRRNH